MARDATIADTLPALLARGAREASGRDALASPGGRAWTHEALAQTVASGGAALCAMGLRRNDRVALVAGHGPAAAVAMLAIASVATCAPLSTRLRADDLDALYAELGARAVVVDADSGPAARDAARSRGLEVIEIDAAGGQVAFRGRAHEAVAPTSAAPDDVALVLPTSGTTGRAKLVPLTHANLAAAALGVARSLELVPGDVGLCVMPLFHVHGIVAGVLAPLAAGSCSSCAPPFVPASFFAWLDAARPTWYSAVPTMHRAVVGAAPGAAGAVARHRLRLVRSSSAALPLPLMRELEALFGVPVVEAYGMTEAAHQIASQPLPPRARKPGSVGLATGPEVIVVDAAGREVPPGTLGEIAIRGAQVTRGYDGAPQANAERFVDGWFRTGDLGSRDRDGHVALAGRIDEQVNRGGEKIAPREVDDALAAHPAVAQAVAFAVPHPTLGDDLAAAVVLREGVRASERELRDFLTGRLSAPKVPSRIAIVDALPTAATGKLVRATLATALVASLVPPASAPDDALEAAIASVVARVLNRDAVGVDDNFFALGGDSLQGMQVAVQIGDVFGVEPGAAAVFRHPSVRELAAAVRRLRDPEADGA